MVCHLRLVVVKWLIFIMISLSYVWHGKCIVEIMMDPNKRLPRHLAVAVLIKLAVLAGLWWAFVRDARVVVDAEVIADRLGSSTQNPGEKK